MHRAYGAQYRKDKEGSLRIRYRKEAWPFYRTITGVRLCWELEEPKEPLGPLGSSESRAKSDQTNLRRPLLALQVL